MAKKLVKGVYNWTMLAIILAGVILVNIISSFVHERIDMTADQRYSLSPATIEYLKDKKNMANRLHMKIYLAGKLPAEIESFRASIEDKLMEFKEYAGNRIEFEFIDPNVGTEEERKEVQARISANGKGILPTAVMYSKDGENSELIIWSGAELVYGGSTVLTVQFLPGTKANPYDLASLEPVIQNATNNLEYMLLSSIRRATQPSKPRIAFLQGHGEVEKKESLRARSVLKPYYDVVDITIGDSVNALDDVDGLVIARPRKKISEGELFIIDQFVMRGGSLMCFVDKLKFNKDSLFYRGRTHTERLSTGIDKMLFNYGAKINDKYVMDAQCGPKNVSHFTNFPTKFIPWFYKVIATTTQHPVARNLEPIKLNYVSNIEFVTSNKDIVISPILTSSTNSNATGLAPLLDIALPLKYGENPELAVNPKDPNNKLCVAGMMEGKFTSYFKNRVSEEYVRRIKEVDPNKTVLNESSKPGKIFVVGNGDFFTNSYDSTLNNTGNGYFYRANDFNDLMMDKDLYQMRQRHAFGNQEFVQNIMDYMMGETSILELRSRQVDIHRIDTEKVKANATYYKILNISVPILSILILAFGIHFIRRKKYTV